jgi:hypothetical protein
MVKRKQWKGWYIQPFFDIMKPLCNQEADYESNSIKRWILLDGYY